jgi:hypothetical protein
MALKAAEKILPSVLVVFLLLSPLLTQSCSAQSTTHEQEKAISFLKDVIQLDMDHYKLTLTGDSINIDTLRLTYKIEPKAFLSLEKSQTLDFQFYNGSLISFDVQPDSDCLVFTQPRPSRFNATLDILERYQIWLNDPQVGEMAALLQQVGSEQSTFHVIGNLSLRIQLYSNTGEYRFSNYINGVEYSGVSISQSVRGSIFFSDNRASQPIGNTTIGISEDQAKAIALEYAYTNPFRGSKQDSKEITNLDIKGVKAVGLKSSPRLNNALYPYYDVQLDIAVGASSDLQGCGVIIGANDGEIWSSYSHSTSTNSLPGGDYTFVIIVIVGVLVCAAIVIGVYESRLRFNVRPDTI